MADMYQFPTVAQKVAYQLHLSSSTKHQDGQALYGGYRMPVLNQRGFTHGNTQPCKASQDLSLITANASPVFVQAPSEKGPAGFVIDFVMGGVSAAVSKTAAASFERIKFLSQKEEERGVALSGVILFIFYFQPSHPETLL